MADILILPVRPEASGQVHRLFTDLATAHEHGLELGPRGPHIQASGKRLLELANALRVALDNLDRLQVELGLEHPAESEILRRLLSHTQELADTAQRFHTVV